MAYSGALKVSTAVVALGAVALTGTGVPLVSRPGCVLIMLYVNATSLALNGLPSFHFTPERVVMVRVFPLFDQLYAVPRTWKGGWLGLMVFQMNSGSLYRPCAVTPPGPPVEVAEYGLKVSVIGERGVSSPTKVLPVADVPWFGLELEPELLQAATARVRMVPTARLFITACFIA